MFHVGSRCEPGQGGLRQGCHGGPVCGSTMVAISVWTITAEGVIAIHSVFCPPCNDGVPLVRDR